MNIICTLVLPECSSQHTQANDASASHQSPHQHDLLRPRDGTYNRDKGDGIAPTNDLDDTCNKYLGSKALNQTFVSEESLDSIGDSSNAVPLDPSDSHIPNGCQWSRGAWSGQSKHMGLFKNTSTQMLHKDRGLSRPASTTVPKIWTLFLTRCPRTFLLCIPPPSPGEYIYM